MGVSYNADLCIVGRGFWGLIMGLVGVVYEVGGANRVTPTKSLPLIKCTTTNQSLKYLNFLNTLYICFFQSIHPYYPNIFYP